MIPLLAGAFLAGLMGSPHCVAMCGPFASACTETRAGLPLWHLGRLASYAALGALAGAFGSALPGPAWLPAALATGFLLWFAAALAGLVPEPRLGLPGLTRTGRALAARKGSGFQLAFGMVNGLLPCGLVYSALSLPVALAAPIPGAVAMIAFGLGTVPALSVAAVGLQRYTARSPGARRLLAALVLTAGLWSIGMRSGILPSAHAGHFSSHQHPTGP